MVKDKYSTALLTAVILGLSYGIAFGAGGARIQNGTLKRLWEERSLPPGADESARVERFLQESRSLLGLPNSPKIEIRLAAITPTALGNRYVYDQWAYGLPVFEGQLVIIAQEDRIRTLFNALSETEFRPASSTISPSTASQFARQATGARELRLPEEVKLGYLASGKLIYRVRLAATNPPIPWEVWVDAETGEILLKRDMRLFVNGTGRIFDPDPKTALESDTLHDWGDSNAAIPVEAYSTVTLLELNAPVGGYYYLDGPYASTSATSNRAYATSPDSFQYWRQDDRFEEVMVYYHIDHEQRYFQNELQTLNANNQQQVCNVNGTAEDNSWYDPYSQVITYGSGGVDDGEDADVILHEYGHAVQADICGISWGWYGHTGAMGEGYGDYLAGSYSLTLNLNFQPNWVFNWDGHNEFWAGRILNANYHYPENANGEIHDSGQLWSAGLMDVWWDIPDRVAWDRIVLQHHFALAYDALMEDAAEAILATELTLYNGIYRDIIVQNFGQRGFIDPAAYYPQIVHDPLGDTEDTLRTQFEVTAQITSQIPLDTTSLQLFWRADEDPFSSVPLTPTGAPDEYHGLIPGPFNGQSISYYLTAGDTIGMAAFSPSGAPTEAYQFYVGPDLYPPQVTWMDSLGQTVFINASFPVKATASDNIGVGSVELFWQAGSSPWQSSPMIPVSADTFQGNLSYTGQQPEEQVQYYVQVTDASSMQNVGLGPVMTFPISVTAQLDDFEGPLGPWTFTGNWGLTTQFSHSGPHSIEDSPGTTYLPNSDTWAQWGESWNLSDFTHARLIFWEQHLLEEGNDWGRLEVSANNGPWQPIFEVSGLEGDWVMREVALDDYCAGASQDLRFRFRTTTDAANNFFGWFIDDVALSVDTIVPVQDKGKATNLLPERYALGPIYPNPFNPLTTIEFDLPESGHLDLRIFNTSGQLVTVLSEGNYPAGSHHIVFDGTMLPSGIYLCRMQAGSYLRVQKLILMK